MSVKFKPSANTVLPKKWIEKSARKRGEVSDKIFDDNRNIPMPLATGEVGDKEFRDVLYRCFVPEENQKVTEAQARKNPGVKINVSADHGWDALFMSTFKLAATIQAIKIRHLVLLSVMSDLKSKQVSYLPEVQVSRKAFLDGTAKKENIVSLIRAALSEDSIKRRYTESVTASGFQSYLNDTKMFVEYRDSMRQFMASDSSYIFKRNGQNVNILWLGDGSIGQPPVPSMSTPAPSDCPSKESFHNDLYSSYCTLPEGSKQPLELLYNEVYESLFNFLSSIIPGLGKDLHGKARAILPMNTVLKPKVSETFMHFLVREDDVFSLDPGFMATRGKYTNLIFYRGFNDQYIKLARAENAQKTSLQEGDAVRCTISGQDGQPKEIVANMATSSRNKKRLCVSYQGQEYKISDCKDLRLYIKEDLDRLRNPDTEMHAAVMAKIYISFEQILPEVFVRGVTQTATGNVSFSSLRTWIQIWQKLKFANSKAFKRMPKYIIPYSQLTKRDTFSTELGTDMSRTDEDNITVDNKGCMLYIPKISEDLPGRYEGILDELLEASYAAEEPFNIDRKTSDPIYKIHRTTEDQEARNEKIEALKHFKLLPLASNWNANVVLFPSKTHVVKDMNLDGAMVPDIRTMADWLGMPTKAGGKYPIGKPSFTALGEMLGTPTFKSVEDLLRLMGLVDIFYQWLMINNKVPKYATLLETARQKLKSMNRPDIIVKLDDETVYGKLFSGSEWLDTGLGFSDEPKGPGTKMFAQAVHLCSYNSPKLRAICANAAMEVEDHPCYINVESETLADLHMKLERILGCAFWIEMCHAINNFCKDQHALEDLMLSGYDLENEEMMKILTFENFSSKIMVQTKLWASYLPNSDDLILKSNAYKETLKKKEGYIPVIPGVKEIDPNDPMQEGFALLPHQVDTLSYSASHPKFMILDVSAGGGKTIIGLSEILIYLSEGVIKKPLVVMPINLIKNWINDCLNRLKAPINFIVITSETVKEWGIEALGKKIESAPPNTIVCTSYNWLYNDAVISMYGIRPVRLFSNVEFLMRYHFDYVAADEAHRIRKAGLRTGGTRKSKSGKEKAVRGGRPSSTHLSFLRTVSNKGVKFIRLLTGTLIKNNLLDLVGQVRALNPAIFRTVEEFKDEYGDPNVCLETTNGRRVQQEIRKYLEEFVVVVKKRKRDWAYLMPEFEDKFDFVDPDDAAIGYYEWILNKTLDQIRAELGEKAWKELTGGVKIKDKVSEEELNGSEEDLDGDEAGAKPSDEPDEEEDMDAIESMLKPYLQRLEQALTDPEGDPEFEYYEQHMAAEGHKIVLSPTKKLKKIYEILEHHFEGKPAIIDATTGTVLEEKEAPFTSLDNASGSNKVLIFCKYHRSVEAVYKYMPEKFKKYARKYSAATKEVLEDFIKRADIKILVALEDSLQEGHNLQFCSRLIRAEQVWTPGEFEQGISRVHRPDVGNKFGRTKIVSNWIVVNRSLEVAKLGRLISKFVSAAKFYEEDEKYQNIDPNNELIPIKMSLEVITGIDKNGHPSDLGKKDWTDIIPYLEAYGMDPLGRGNVKGLAQYLQDDFELARAEAKATGNDKMVPVKAAPMMEGSKIIKDIPYIMGQAVHDPDDLGLVPLKDWIEANPEAQKNLDKAVTGLPVHTAFGEGVIQCLEARRTRKKKGQTSENGDAENGENDDQEERVKEPRVSIRIGSQNGVKKSFKMDVVFVITKVSTNTKKLLKASKGVRGPEVEPTSTPKQTTLLEKLRAKKQQKKTETTLVPPKSAKPVVAPADTGETEEARKHVLELHEKRTGQLASTQKKLKLMIKNKAPKAEIVAMQEREKFLQDKLASYNKKLAKLGKAPKIENVEKPVAAKPALKDLLKQKKAAAEPKATKMELQSVKKSLTPTLDTEKNLSVDVFPMDCNGLPTLLLSHDDPDSDKIGRKLKFQFFGSYLYAEVKTAQQLTSLISALKEEGYTFTTTTENVLTKMEQTFRGTKNKERAFLKMKTFDKRVFFGNTTFTKRLKDPNQLRIYPIIEGDGLLALYINASVGDPAVLRLRKQKRTASTPPTRWYASNGMWVYQAPNKAALINKLSQFKEVGVKVTNLKEVKAELNELF